MKNVDKAFKVINAIASLKAFKGQQTIFLHPEDDNLKDLKIIDLDNVLHQLQMQKLIELRKTSSQSHIELQFKEIIFGEVSTPEFEESYKVLVLDKFDEYYEENKSKINPSLEDTGKSIIWILYSESSREILLNNIFLLSRPS